MGAATEFDTGDRGEARKVVALGHVGRGYDEADPGLFAAMALAARARRLGALAGGRQRGGRGARQAGLIALDGQYVVAAARDNGRRHGAVAVQGIGRHHAALQSQQANQLHGGLDLVAVRRQHAGQCHRRLGAPGAHHDAGHMALAALVGTPQRLAVERHHALGPLDLRARREGGHKPPERGLERHRVEHAKDARERIVAWDAVLERQDLAQKRLLGDPELGQVRTVPRATKRGQQSNKQDLDQIVPGIVRARIGNLSKALVKTIHRCLLHRKTPSESVFLQTARHNSQSYAIPLGVSGGPLLALVRTHHDGSRAVADTWRYHTNRDEVPWRT